MNSVALCSADGSAPRRRWRLPHDGGIRVEDDIDATSDMTTQTCASSASSCPGPHPHNPRAPGPGAGRVSSTAAHRGSRRRYRPSTIVPVIRPSTCSSAVRIHPRVRLDGAHGVQDESFSFSTPAHLTIVVAAESCRAVHDEPNAPSAGISQRDDPLREVRVAQLRH